MADSKASDLTTVASVDGDELLYLVDDPSGTPADRKVSVDDLLAATPSATTSAAGIVELATSAEVDTGTDTTRAITPDALANSALQSTADSALQSADIGSTVQGYDADTLKADTADTLTVGFDSSDYAAGTKSSGTYTPDPADGNFQVATNGGAHTLAPPSTSCTIIIHYTNNGSAGAITTSGFTIVNGDSFDTTDTNEFIAQIVKINDVSTLTVTALQ